MDSWDQAAGGGDWRMQLRDMRTVSGLRADTPRPEAAERLTDRALIAAAQNPDHSEAGRAAAAEAARARNVTVTSWRMRVPGFITHADLAEGERLFFGWGRALRHRAGMVTLLALAAMFVAAGFSVAATEELRVIGEARGLIGAEALSERGFSWSAETSAPLREALINEPALARAYFAERIGLALAGVFGASAFVWLIATWLRRKPARVLLLRKFNVRALSSPLTRMMRRELRVFGHVATLSDKHIKRDHWGWLHQLLLSVGNPLAFAVLVITTPIRFVWRLFDRSAMGPATVLNARDYRNLARRLRDRMGLNLQVALVSKEAFMVRTSDRWWRLVVQLLMDSADAIVIDLSQVTAGTEWELDVIQAHRAEARCVFVALWGKADEAAAHLRARGISRPVFHYAPDGEIQGRPSFRSAMVAAMRATHGAA